MALSKRQRQMLESIRDQSKVTVAELSKLFKVTEVSIRHDLTDLENAGFIRRFHGGARIIPASVFENKAGTHLSEKKGIARQALSHVQEGETLFLDSGTTVLLLAKELTGVGNLTVTTNSPPLLAYLGPEPDKRVILIGGEYNRDSECCSGIMTEQELEGIYVSKVFMGADSVDVDSGAVFADLRNMGYILKIMKNAKQTILLADSSKFNRIHGMKIANLSQVDLIITDHGLSSEQREKIRKMGISLEIVE